MEAVKPAALFEATVKLTVFLRKVSISPEAQLLGASIETDKNSWTFTWNVVLAVAA